MSTKDWENQVWSDLPWHELLRLGAIAIAWPLAAIAANDPRRPPHQRPPAVAHTRDPSEDDSP